jgi:CRP-like cAMP-binding protein
MRGIRVTPPSQNVSLRENIGGRLDGSAILHLDFFSGFEAAVCDQIARSSHVVHLRKGKPAFIQDEQPREMLMVLNGRLKAIHVTPDGGRLVTRLMGPGDLAGHVYLFRNKPYAATAAALTDTILLTWPRPVFEDLMARHPPLALAVVHSLAKSLEEADARLHEAATERTERRIAHAILRLVAQAGRRVDGGIEVSFPVTRNDIALMSGANLYTVSRILSGWKERGIVDGGRQHLVVSNPHALVKIAEEE